jgi:uncharacterized membrane protein YfcA
MTDTVAFSVERFLFFMALGFGTGLYGTLIGAGGGFVLMPILLLLFPKESPEQLTSISLAVVFFNALGGSEAYAMMRRIDYRSGLMFAAATIPGAIVGALNTSFVPRRLFDVIFGLLLISGAVFLFLRGGEEARRIRHYQYQVSRHLVEANGVAFDYSFNPWVGIVLSLGVGYISSFLGIGGGIIHVPAMTYFLNFPVHVATATSHFVLAIMAFTGTVTHVLRGTFPASQADLTLSLAIGVLLGAPLGAYISGKIHGNWIIQGLALALVIVGFRILAVVL